MKRNKRIISAVLAAVLGLGTVLTAGAAADEPVCDETLYVTLNQYGEIRESSVVKGYTVNGCSRIEDYGTYDGITNMTDHSEPSVDGGKVIFELEKPADRFYFEGVTQVKEEELPWTIRVGYRLNGQEKKAEELAGAAGLIEINVDLLPNKRVSDYYRNNMTLMATTVVDMDKNLSLEAEGTQIQAMGNLNAVLFFALPGEEQHYSIRIGTNDFKFSGLVFTMVPLTVAQLDKVADIRDAKETLEDSADSISESLDVIFNTLDGMQAGMTDAADGIRGLNETREIFAGSKAQVYDTADVAIGNMDALAQKFAPFSTNMKEARDLLNDLNLDISDLVESLDDLSPLLSELRHDVAGLRNDMDDLREAINHPAVDMAAESIGRQMEKTKSDLENLKVSQRELSGGVAGLASAVPSLIASAGAVKTKASALVDREELEELAEELDDAGIYDEDEAASYLFNNMDYTIDEIDTLVAYLMPENDRAATASEAGRAGQAGLMDALDAIVEGVDGTIGNTSLTDDVEALITQSETILQALAAQRGSVSGALKNIRDIADTAADICDAADDVISSIDTINRTVDEHHDEILSTLNDMGELTDSAYNSLISLTVFSTALENQLKSISDPLNSSTKQTLNGLAAILDDAGEGLGQTNVLRSAKNTIKDMIDDKWDEYTTEDTTILNVDPDAAPVSFTSTRNPSPRTIQIVLRTEEIKEEKVKSGNSVDEEFHSDGSIFHRIANIFRRIWELIEGLFS